MKKRLTMILACLFLFAGMALAQTAVTGTVVSADDGQPVIGASVKVVGSKGGTVTNVDGEFTIIAPEGARLEVSYVGMKPATVKAGSSGTTSCGINSMAEAYLRWEPFEYHFLFYYR